NRPDWRTPLLVAGLAGACGDSRDPAPPATRRADPPSAPSAGAATEAAAPGGSARGLRHREEGAFDGYTLIAPLNSRSVYLVDLAGTVVHEWKTAHLTAGGA